MPYSLEEIGRRAKERNPELSKFSDAEVGSRLVKRNPNLASLLAQAPEAAPPKSFLRKVGDVFTAGTQKFAETLGSAAAVASGATKRIDEAKMAESESRFNLAKQLRTASPEQAARIKSQLGQGVDVQTATEAIPALMKTNKQVLGEGLMAGLEATSGGLLSAGKTGALSKAVPAVAAKTFGQAVGRGAGRGAIYGGLAGASQGLQQDKSLGGIVASTATGGAFGGVLGGSIGAAGYGLGKLRQTTNKGLEKLPGVASKKSEDIYRKVLKMTPTEQMREKASGKNTPALLKKMGATGTLDEITEVVQNSADEVENTLSSELSAKAKAGTTVSVKEFEKVTKASLDKYKTHLAEYSSIRAKLKSIVDNAQELYGDKIPVDVANDIKRALWKDAFSKTGADIVNDAVYEAGNAMKKLVEDAVPDAPIAAMNKELGGMVVALKQLAKSSTRLQSGKMSSRLGAIIGGVIGLPGGPYGAIGTAALGSQVDKLLLSNVTLRTQIAQLLARMEGQAPQIQKATESQIIQLLERHGIMAAAREAVKNTSP